MYRYRYCLGLCAFLMGVAALMIFDTGSVAAQDATPTPAAEEEVAAEPTQIPVEEAAPADEDSHSLTAMDRELEIPHLLEWMNSPHADAEAEAFVHWDEDDPQEVPASCARCHSTPGYQDYLGADGSEAGAVDSGHPVGTVVECAACHNDVASHLTAVTFPSGVEISGIDSSAQCMVCHQGRSSTDDVAAAIEEAGLSDAPDTVSEDLGFINIHYYAAAASLYGGDVRGGFQYEDARYQPKFEHGEGIDSCIDCHQPHTLELRIERCSTCHEGITSAEALHDVRMPGSLRDYDGDGDVEEGIYHELEGLRTVLAEAIQAYGATVNETPIGYDSHSYPYFFIDTDGDGELAEEEASFPNRYNAWTPRLLQAAYNYQTSLKDPGAYAHNAKYHIQLLHDSILSLNEALAEPVDMGDAQRDDAGHFDATAEAFVHFLEEEDGMTPASCAKCHNAAGLPFFLEHGVTIKQPLSSSLACTTCHLDTQEYGVHEVTEVEFPSGAVLSFDDSSNLCLNCHQGRESSFSVNAAIIRSGADADEISEALRFLNPHYFAAGATVFGGEAAGAYQFDGKEYAGRYDHVRRFNTCSECHTAHELQVQVVECADCHDFAELTDIREPEVEGEPIDWDGDGDINEGIAGEIATMHEALLPAIQAYTEEVIGEQLGYAPHNYPYWYLDSNGNGVIDEDEVTRENRFSNWTPNLLRGAYNYQYVAKDPGAFTHNSEYILQVLFDSLEAIGGAEAVAGMTRP